MLACTAGLAQPLPIRAPAATCTCAAHPGVGTAADPGTVTLLADELLHAASCAGEQQLVRTVVMAASANVLLSALACAASREPAQVATLLRARLGAAGAFALGGRLQEAQASACSACASRAADDIERTFECVGAAGGEAQRAARERLLRLERDFSDAAAARVLRETLGVDLTQLAAAHMDTEVVDVASEEWPSGGMTGTSGEKRKR